MSTDHSKFIHLAGPKAVVLAKVIDGVNSADTLSKAGISYPVAIELSRQISAGVGDVFKLHRMGFSVDTAKAVVTAINAAGAH